MKPITWCPACHGRESVCARCDGEGTVEEESLSGDERDALQLDAGPSARDEEREAAAFFGGDSAYSVQEEVAIAARLRAQEAR